MSLINDALKKAREEKEEPQVPSAGTSNSGEEKRPPPRRRTLRGVIFTMLIGGFAASGLSLYLAASILKEEPAPAPSAKPPPTKEPVRAANPVPEEKRPDPAKSVPEEAPILLEEPGGQEPAISAETKGPATADLPEPTQAPNATKEAADATKSGEAPPPPPDPALAERVAGLRVRGIVSGGKRVLLYDPASGDTKAYEPGDRLDGEPRLLLEGVEKTKLHFRDPHGNRLTQFF